VIALNTVVVKASTMVFALSTAVLRLKCGRLKNLDESMQEFMNFFALLCSKK